MAGKGYFTFDEFKAEITLPDGKPNEAGMNKIDAIIAQKILGKKVKASPTGNFFLRVEPPSDKYPKGASIRVKQYTRSAEAIEELLDEVTVGDVMVCRYYNNSTIKGQPGKGQRYHVSIQFINSDDKIEKTEQKGSSFNMNIVTIAALLRWKGILLAPGQTEPTAPAQ